MILLCKLLSVAENQITKGSWLTYLMLAMAKSQLLSYKLTNWSLLRIWKSKLQIWVLKHTLNVTIIH